MKDSIVDLNEQYLESELENKIRNDQDILSNSKIDIEKLLKDAKEMRSILHIRESNKKRIIDEFEMEIVVNIPEGSEDTLIRDLEKFNSVFYDDRDKIFTGFKSVEDKETTDDDLDELNYVEFENVTENETSKSSLQDEDITQLLEGENGTIVVEDEEDKYKILDYVENEIDNGDFKFIKINKPLAISGRRIHRKIKNLRERFIDSYGSEIFRKVSNWIVEEQNIYNNLDRIERINRYKKNKMKLADKMKMKERLKKFFK